MFAAVAHSVDPDVDAAIDDIVADLRSQAGDEPIQAGIVFACIDMDHQRVLDRLGDAFPGIRLVGCTTDGEVTSAMRFQEDSLAVMVFGSHQVAITTGVGRSVARDPSAAAREAVAMATADNADPSLCVVFPESLTASGVSIVGCMVDALPHGVTLVGGTAGDQWRFSGTRQFFGREVLTDALPVLVMGSGLRMGVGLASGWRPVGARARITKALSNVVYEIDDAPAVDYYRRYFGPTIDLSPENPLGVFPPGSGEFYLRAPLGYDAAVGSVTFAGDVPVGSEVLLTEGQRGDLLEACHASVAQAQARYGPSTPSAAVIVSCAARKQILGTRTADEYDAFAAAWPSPVPVIGFYSYGEIAPLEGRTCSDFHNETFVTLLLGAA